MIFKKKISEEEKRFLQKQEEMNKLIEELENARDEEIALLSPFMRLQRLLIIDW